MQNDIIYFNFGHTTKDDKGQKKCYERKFFMHKHGFLKGMAAGLLLGACATMVFDPISDRQRHRMMRKTEGVFRSIGNIIDNAVDMIR